MTSPANIKESTRHTAQNLSYFLADTYLLYLKTQNFHWNVKGPRFFFLHQLFEEHYKELAEAIDQIAEQIRSLKMRSPGSMKEFLALGSLPEAPEHPSSEEMLSLLLRDHESIIEGLHEKIGQASHVKDEATADLLIERLRAHEKMAWMLRSHSDEEPNMQLPL